MWSQIKLVASLVMIFMLISGLQTTFAETIGLWHMNENSDTTAADLSGHNYNFTNVGTGAGSLYCWTGGKSGSGLSVVPDNNSYLSTTIDSSHLTYVFTAEVWIKPSNTDSSGESAIFGVTDAFLLTIMNSGNSVRMAVRTSDDQWPVADATVSVFDGRWHQIVGIYDGTQDLNGNGHVYLYWDGQLRGTCAFAVPAGGRSIMGGSGNTYIGTNPWNPAGGTQNYSGWIDEVQLSNSNSYAADSHTIGLWYLDEYSGSIAGDVSTSGYDFLNIGTGTGSSYYWAIDSRNGSGLWVPSSNDSYLSTTIDPANLTYIFTAEAWIKPSNTDTSSQSEIFGVTNAFVLELNNSGNGVRMVINTDDGQWPVATASVNALDGNWHHIVGIYDGTQDLNGNGHVYLYWDNQLRGTYAFAVPASGRAVMGGSGNVYIGTNPWNPTGGTQNYSGGIDEIRLSNIDRYSESDPNLVCVWNMDEYAGNTAGDATFNGTDVLNVGIGTGTSYSWAAGHSGYGLYAPADNNSYLTATTGMSTFTYQASVEAWIKPTNTDSSTQSIVLGVLNAFALEINNSGNGIRMVTNTNDSQWPVASATINTLDGQWHHVAGIYDGVPDAGGYGHVILIWDNQIVGVYAFSVPSGGRPLMGGSGNIYIGTNPWNPTGGTQNYSGYIDDVKIRTTSIYDVLFENSNYRCTLNMFHLSSGGGYGLRWGKIYNKTTKADCLLGGANMPVFKVLGDSFSLDSSQFIVNSITPSGNTCTIVLSYPSPALLATLAIVSDANQQMLWTLNVQNTGGSAINLQPIFPVVGRVQMGYLQDNQYFYPWQGGVVQDVSSNLSTEYGALSYMQIMGIFNPVIGSGIYTYPKDSGGGFKGLVLKKIYSGQSPVLVITTSNTAVPLEMPSSDVLSDIDQGLGMAYYYPKLEIAASGIYSLPQTVVAIGQSGWKDALINYSNWAHTWYNHVNTPQWFKNCFTFISEYPDAYYSTAYNKYIKSESNCFENMTQWAGWWQSREDANYPDDYCMEKWQIGDYYYNTDHGGLSPFHAEIDKIQAKGMRASVYTDYQFAWQYSDVGQAYGQTWARMSSPGVYAVYSGHADEKWLGCFYDPNGWSDWYADMCARVVRDTGMDCMYLDELNWIMPCYNSAHTHYQQDKFPVSLVRIGQNLTKVRNGIVAEKSDATIMVEHVASDYLSQFIDAAWDSMTFNGNLYGSQNDENKLHYFRFCFPETRIATLIENPIDFPQRSLFNGLGTGGVSNEYTIKAGQVLKENGDAVMLPGAEPLIPTLVGGILANKFPTSTKVVYTVYNKNRVDANQAIFEVPTRSGYHYVELFDDTQLTPTVVNGKDRLSFAINARQVLCVAQLPNNITIGMEDSNVIPVTITQPVSSGILAAWLNTDTSQYGMKHAKIITLTNNQANVNVVSLFGRRGKLIFKYLLNENVLDEKTYGIYIAQSQGTLALWQMDEGTGGYAYNSVVSGSNTFALGSDYSWTTAGKTNNAITSTNPSNSYCAAYLYAGDLAKQFTIEAWIKPAACDTEKSVIFGVFNCFTMEFLNDGASARIVVNTDDDQWQVAQADVTAFDGQWHHIAGVYDGMPDGSGNGHVYLYFNKQLVTTYTFTVPTGGRPVKGGMDAYIGANPWAPDNQRCNYSGAIDEIRLSNFVKSLF